MAPTFNRREEDRNQHLISRLERLEAEVATVRSATIVVENKSALMEAEQRHIREIMDAQFSVVTQTQATHSAKFDTILSQISLMLTEPAKTPGGSAMIQSLTLMTKDVEENRAKVEVLERWQDRVDGVLLIVKFLGAAGLAGLILSLLRVFKVIP